MIDFFASLTVGLIVVMTLVILLSNYHQAHELHHMQKVMQGWVDAQMRDRREKHSTTVKVNDPLKWFGDQAGLVLTDLQRNLEQPPALEFLAEQGMRLVVSPLAAKDLRRALKPFERKKRKIIKLVEPLLGSRRRDLHVIEKSQATSGEWFDLEARSASAAFMANWPDCSHLWFYVISPTLTQPKIFLKFDWAGFKEWFIQRKGKVLAWFKMRPSKSSS
jgi:hypothetical protein